MKGFDHDLEDRFGDGHTLSTWDVDSYRHRDMFEVLAFLSALPVSNSLNRLLMNHHKALASNNYTCNH